MHVGDEANGPRRPHPPRRVRCAVVTRAATTRHRASSGALAGALAVLLVSCGGAEPARDSSGTITTPGETRLLNLRAGDCIGDLHASIDDPDGGHNGVPSVKAVACSQRHDAEVLQIAQIDGDPWPGYSVVQGEAARSRAELRQRILKADVDGDVKLFSFSPSKERWNFEDQHEIVYIALFAKSQRGALKAAGSVSGGA